MASESSGALVRLGSVGLVWVGAAVGAVAVVSASAPPRAYGWLLVLAGSCLLLSFALQLVVGLVDGFILRVTASVAGAFLILVAGTVALLLVHAG